MSRTPIHRPLPRLATGVAVLALGLAGLTACGGSNSGSTAASSSTSESSSASTAADSSSGSESPAGGSAEVHSLTATETNFKISLSEDKLTAGTYAIKVVNNGSATHDLAVAEDGTTKATSDSVAPGESTTLTVDLDAGQYVFYCAIGNHRAMGMELTVPVR